MSLHEEIITDMHRVMDMTDADIVTPASLARAVQSKYRSGKLEPHIEYTSFEHFKQLARKVLSGRLDTESDENESYQGELFTGRLQTRYPIPRQAGDEPAYKLLERLTDAEVKWNIRSLRKSADARLEHADALEAWHRSREAA